MRKLSLLGCLSALTIVMAPASGSAQSWTDWTGITSTTVTGSLAGVQVTYTGGFAGASLVGGTNYWSPSGAYTQGGLTAPNLNDFIQIVDPVSGTISFSSAVVNPYFALISVGAPGTAVTYTFDSPFTILSTNLVNCAFWGCGTYSTGANSLTGTEFSGTIQFIGTFSSISFTTDPSENWHGFTVGADRAAEVVPEPATMSLLATGLAGMAAAARKRRKSA